ncbi:MAG: glycosyltransferase [Patescibacteria group bacterium]|jgi:glycosyltransferase involved in cell wall biosynthesis
MISFVIPTLNEASVLEKTLINLKRLTFCPAEIIVSDGNSRDQTQAIATRLGARLVVYRGATRQTIANGRNLGAAAASGDYLVSMDADVIINKPNEFFSVLLDKFEKNSRLAGLTVSLKVLPEDETWADKVIFKLVNTVFFLINNVLPFGGASGEFQIVRASAFRQVGGFNEKLVVAEDNDFFHRLRKIGETRIVWGLTAYHTGRRAHKVGWPKLLFSWLTNWLSVFLFKKSATKEWHEVR